MANFQIKTESLAVRCDICHQADLFNPATGVCTRCEGFDPAIATQSTVEITTRRPLYQYVGPRNRSFGAYCWNAYLGGLVAALLLSLPFFLFLGEVNFLQPFDSPLNVEPSLALFFLFFILPNMIAGIRTYRFLIHSNEPFPLAKLWSAGGNGSAGSTVVLFVLLFISLFGSQSIFRALRPLETFFGLLTLALPLCIVSLILNSVAGRMVATVIRFIEKDRIVPETVVNAEEAG